MNLSIRCVLVVDDNLDLRRLVASALQLEGYEVFEAAHGKEALEFLATRSSESLPGSILLDIMMPIMDGPAFVEALLATNEAAYRDIPIIVVSAKSRSLESSRIPHTVARLQKPVDLAELYSAVAKYHRSA